MVRRTVQYGYGTGKPANIGTLLDHYRNTLSINGWTITAEQPLDLDNPAVHAPGYQLHASGHGHHNITITAQQGKPTATVQVTITKVDTERTQSANPPPTIDMPAWYQELPPPLAGTIRYQIRITTTSGNSTYLILYDDQQTQPDMQTSRATTLADYYRHTLAALGWTILAQQNHVERDTLDVRGHTIEMAGHQVTGTVHTTQTTSLTGQWLGATVAIRINDPEFADPPPQPPGGIHER